MLSPLSHTGKVYDHTSSENQISSIEKANFGFVEKIIHNAMGVQFTSPDGQAGVHIDRSHCQWPCPYIFLYKPIVKAWEKNLGFSLIELDSNTHFLSGQPALRVIGIWPQTSLVHQGYNASTDEESMLYVANFTGTAGVVWSFRVSYQSPPETYLTYLPIVQRMIDSFQAVEGWLCDIC